MFQYGIKIPNDAVKIQKKIPRKFYTQTTTVSDKELEGTLIDPRIVDRAGYIEIPSFNRGKFPMYMISLMGYHLLPRIIKNLNSELSEDKQILFIPGKTSPRLLYYNLQFYKNHNLFKKYKYNNALYDTWEDAEAAGGRMSTIKEYNLMEEIFNLNSKVYVIPLRFRQNFVTREGISILHPITSIYNWLLQQIGIWMGVLKNNNYHWNIKSDIAFQNAYTNYESLILKKYLLGKNGLLARQVAGVRCRRSARAVVSFNPNLRFGWVGIPTKIMKVLMLQDGSNVIINRAPSLWDGSILSCKAIGVKGNALQLHPLVCTSLNADADGDTMSIFAPDDIETQLELAERNYNNDEYINRFVDWQLEMKLVFDDTKPKSCIDINQQMKPRFDAATDGMSCGLDDLSNLSNSATIDRLKKSKIKYLKNSEIEEYADGYSSDKYWNKFQSTIEDFTMIKIGTAFAGSLGSKIVNIMGPDKGQFVLEKLSQSILQRKHGKNNSVTILEETIKLLQREGDNLPPLEDYKKIFITLGFRPDVAESIQHLLISHKGKSIDEIMDNHYSHYQMMTPWGKFENLLQCTNMNAIEEGSPVGDQMIDVLTK